MYWKSQELRADVKKMRFNWLAVCTPIAIVEEVGTKLRLKGDVFVKKTWKIPTEGVKVGLLE